MGVTLSREYRPAQGLPFVLLGVLVYTLARKEMGRHHEPRPRGVPRRWWPARSALVIGFYDGFFGPGTGSFFVFLFVRLLGYDFLHATVPAPSCSTPSPTAPALALFAFKGHVWWQYRPLLAVANVAGSLLGTRLALRHGAGFVRCVFIVVVSALIPKTGYDAFLR